MSKVRADKVKIFISKLPMDKMPSTEPQESDLVGLSCDLTNMSIDFGSSEEIDVSTLCTVGNRDVEFGLSNAGSLSGGLFFEPDKGAYRVLKSSFDEKRKHYIKMVSRDLNDKILLTETTLGTVTALSRSTDVGSYQNCEVTVTFNQKVNDEYAEEGEG